MVRIMSFGALPAMFACTCWLVANHSMSFAVTVSPGLLRTSSKRERTRWWCPSNGQHTTRFRQVLPACHRTACFALLSCVVPVASNEPQTIKDTMNCNKQRTINNTGNNDWHIKCNNYDDKVANDRKQHASNTRRQSTTVR